MGGNAMNWAEVALRKKMSIEYERTDDLLRQQRAEIYSKENASQREWLEEVLMRSSDEGDEALLLSGMEWLEANPSRMLSPAFQELFGFLDRRSRGEKVEVPDAVMRCVRAARIRRTELEASRPEWMRDPSKLPKKPPSRPVIEEDE